MSWEGEAVITGEEMEKAITESSQKYLKLFSDRGVPIGPEWLVEQEMKKLDGEVTYTFRWKKKPPIQ
tara:strand:+ start:7456 stop:7656 length:201 start_codon:yes stop_codon:yes gene_type:complete